MAKYIFLLASFFLLALQDVSANVKFREIVVVTYCDGTQIVHTAPGKLERRVGQVNTPACSQVEGIQSQPISTLAQKEVKEIVTNCSGLQITSYTDGSYMSQYVVENTPGCISSTLDAEIIEVAESIASENPPETPRVKMFETPLLDLASTEIVEYRAQLLKDRGVRFAEVVRSARIRRAANMQSETNAYLMRNDAVVIEGKETGWVKVQGADLFVTDLQENTVEAFTGGKARGYTASRLLREPNISDLVRIEQADHAYWSDIAVTNVARYVNVRSHPSHTAKIVTTLGDDYPLYVVSTVDNWSLVRNDEGTVSGYIRSDFITVIKHQRADLTK